MHFGNHVWLCAHTYNHSKRMCKFAKSNRKFPKGKILEANWYIVLRFQVYWKWWNHESSDSGKRSFTHFSRLPLKCINKITLYISWSRKDNKMHKMLKYTMHCISESTLVQRLSRVDLTPSSRRLSSLHSTIFYRLTLRSKFESHWLPLFSSYRSSWEKLIKYQANSSCVIISVILMTSLFYKALILQGEIWCWSLFTDLKG